MTPQDEIDYLKKRLNEAETRLVKVDQDMEEGRWQAAKEAGFKTDWLRCHFDVGYLAFQESTAEQLLNRHLYGASKSFGEVLLRSKLLSWSCLHNADNSSVRFTLGIRLVEPPPETAFGGNGRLSDVQKAIEELRLR